MHRTSKILELQLSAHEIDLIAQFDRQLQLVRDRTRSVIFGHAVGSYITGRTGTSKTHTVTNELAQQEVPWLLHNARLTPMGLFELLREHPHHIVVLDDIPLLAKDPAAVQILLAALGGTPHEPRIVKYKSRDKELRLEYCGRLVLIGNVPLGRDPMAQAVAGRVLVLEHDPSDDDVAAYCKNLALRGYRDLTPANCWEVAEFVIEQTRACDLRLDLRHFYKALEDYRQAKAGHADSPWQILVKSSLQRPVREFIRPPSKQEEIELQRQTVLELIEQLPDDVDGQLREFKKRHKVGKSTYYERRREVKSMGIGV